MAGGICARLECIRSLRLPGLFALLDLGIAQVFSIPRPESDASFQLSLSADFAGDQFTLARAQRATQPILGNRGTAAVNIGFIVFFLIVAALLIVLLWALRSPKKRKALSVDLTCLEQTGRRHATYLPLIRQALSPADFLFLSSRGSPELARRASKERRRIALSYLAELRDDFHRLLRLARVVAALSPEVGAVQELERLRLGLEFSWRYQMVRAGLYSDLRAFPRLNELSLMVSNLAVRMEAAMKELGERAAIAAELTSALDRRGVDIA